MTQHTNGPDKEVEDLIDATAATPDPLNGYLARLLADGAWASSNEATRHIRDVLGFVGPAELHEAIAAAEARGYRSAIERQEDLPAVWVVTSGVRWEGSYVIGIAATAQHGKHLAHQFYMRDNGDYRTVHGADLPALEWSARSEPGTDGTVTSYEAELRGDQRQNATDGFIVERRQVQAPKSAVSDEHAT
jgi:hypothetical protein